MGLGNKIGPDMESTPEDLQFARGTFPQNRYGVQQIVGTVIV